MQKLHVILAKNLLLCENSRLFSHGHRFFYLCNMQKSVTQIIYLWPLPTVKLWSRLVAFRQPKAFKHLVYAIVSVMAAFWHTRVRDITVQKVSMIIEDKIQCWCCSSWDLDTNWIWQMSFREIMLTKNITFLKLFPQVSTGTLKFHWLSLLHWFDTILTRFDDSIKLVTQGHATTIPSTFMGSNTNDVLLTWHRLLLA